MTGELRRWTVEVGETDARFTWTPLQVGHTAANTVPRAWDGHGLGVPAHDVPVLNSALKEIMKTPAFWQAYRSAGRGAAQVWSEPHTDPDDGFVYVTGPCGLPSEVVGYRPVSSFTLDLADLRGLRIRLAAHLHDHLVGA
ncbi:hypothetical protein ACQPXB_21605 [Amycolatopsis sp. CA-161197]|uniref:hypothetical protein n=1 Tax=Amycolatopsis sp. CA-161197 TaxID=3239922 RepID=UPI003D8A6A7C